MRKSAELAKVNYKYYQEVEAGRKTQLRIPTVEKMAKAYGLNLHQLFAPSLPKVRLKLKPNLRRRRRVSK